VAKNPSAAVIDIGSNSIKLLVAARPERGPLVALKSRTLDARISAGISQTPPRLAEAGMTAGLGAIRELLADAAVFSPAKIVLVATSAVRDAANGAEFCARVHAGTKKTVRILSGEEEANFIGAGLVCDPALTGLRDFYVFDLGGGSLECLAFRDRHVTQEVSLTLGCVRLTEKFMPDPAAPFSTEAGASVAAHVREALAQSGFSFASGGMTAVFAGGSMTTVRSIFAAQRAQPLERTPPVVAVTEIRALLDRIAPLPLAERKKVHGLPPSRADVFPVALATILAVADAAGVSQFQHSLYNLRWGVAAEALGNS